MPQVIVTEHALSDIRRLTGFYRKKSESAYKKATNAFKEAVKQITRFPEIGRICPEYPDYREWLIPFGSSGFIFLYAVNDEECFILAARHQSEVGYSLTIVC